MYAHCAWTCNIVARNSRFYFGAVLPSKQEMAAQYRTQAAHSILGWLQGKRGLRAKQNPSRFFHAERFDFCLKNSSHPPHPHPGFFLSLALPVFPGASHSSAWMYFLLFWQVASLAGLEREALWMVTIAANDYTKDHVIDNKWNHKCKEIFSTFFFFFFFNSAWFLTLCHLSVCHIILDLRWTCHDQ